MGEELPFKMYVVVVWICLGILWGKARNTHGREKRAAARCSHCQCRLCWREGADNQAWQGEVKEHEELCVKRSYVRLSCRLLKVNFVLDLK